MGKVVEKKGKKKKGRPSLLDIQKRNLRLQKEQQQLQQTKTNPNPNFNSNPNPHRRFTRRNPDPDAIAAENGDNDDDDNDDDVSKGSRRERKLNHVLRVPPNQRSAVNSPYLDLGLYGSDSNEEDEEGDDDDDDDDDDDETPLKKRKINAAAGDGGSAHNVAKKQQQQQGEKHNSAWKATEKNIGTPLESGPTTPLPDKKLLVFILDRIQKKDTYGVYAEPVDPEELPDYHEIIENPMDFGTVRKKLEDGAYANLEQFESDVFLITSNAMQYNAPDTVYFRQARTIQELAKKNFENLRLDSDNENKPKIVRRGRPPTKHLKKSLGKTSSECDGSDATPTKGGDNAVLSNSYNLRKGHQSDKYVSADTSRRTSYGSRNSDAYSWLLEHKSEKSDEFLGSSVKGFSMKYGKKQFVADESRRNTYMNFHPSVVGSQSSVLNTFDGETKQLLPVGLHTEHGYARSLARFAANLGPVAWKVASKKIARALPPGMKFGPGWVGDDEAPPVQTSLLTTSFSCSLPQQPPFSSTTQMSSSTAMPLRIESKGDMLSEEFTNNSLLDGYPNRPIPSTIASSSTSTSRCPELVAEPVEAGSRNTDGKFGLMSNGSGGIRPPFQIHQSPPINPGMNGFSGGFGSQIHQSPPINPGMNGFSGGFGSQMGKLVRPAWAASSLNPDTSVHSRILDMVSKSNFIHSMPGNHSEMNSKLSGSSSTLVANSIQAGTGVGFQAQTCWNGLLVPPKPDSMSTDLNVRFQSPGSPSSSVMVDSPQPDLALQL